MIAEPEPPRTARSACVGHEAAIIAKHRVRMRRLQRESPTGLQLIFVAKLSRYDLMSRSLAVLANSVSTAQQSRNTRRKEQLQLHKSALEPKASEITLALIFHQILGAAALRMLSRFSLGHKLPRLYKT